MASYVGNYNEIANFQLTMPVYNYFAGAAMQAGGQGWDPMAIDQALYAWIGDMYNELGSGQAAADALSECNGWNASDSSNCQTVAVSMGSTVPSAAIQELVDNPAGGFVFYVALVNNTSLNLSTNANESAQQCYMNGIWVTGPSGQIPPVSQPAASGCLYSFGMGYYGYGPSGAFSVSMTDPNDGTLVGNLCIAFSDPVKDSNTYAVSFNQPLQPWFDSFNSSKTNTPTAVLSAGNTTLYASAAMSRAQGDATTPLIMVVLSQTPFPEGMLVQAPGSPVVYFVFLGQACPLPDTGTAEALFGSSWGTNVQQVTPAQLESTPQGPPLTSGACLVIGDGPQQYLYTWGLRFWITTEAVRGTYGFTNGSLNGLPQAVILAMPQGADLTW